MSSVDKLTYVLCSEEYHSFHQPGSVLFAQPAEVDNWCQSIYPEVYPLTPPDTASDCAPSDCPEMYDPSWNQASLPEDSWATAPASDNSRFLQSSRQWTTHGAAPSRQDMQTLDASSWVPHSHGSVDTGLSPVLSHESQTAHTLHSIPESDFPLLPPGLDLSFIGEPTGWNAPASVVYPAAPQDMSAASMVSSPESMPSGPHMQSFYPASAASQTVMYGPHQPMFSYQEMPVHQQRAGSDPSSSSPRRLLPRMDAPVMPANYANGQVYTLQPQYPVAHAENAPRVSSAQHSSKETQAAGTAHGHGLLTPPPRPESSSPGLPQVPAFVSDPGCDDFSSFVRYDQEEHAPPVQMRFDYAETVKTVCGTDK